VERNEAIDSQHLPALDVLLTRHSLGPRWMVEPGPTPDELRLAVRAALRAPDHGSLRPWRVAIVAPQQRGLLADRFAAFARDVGKDEAEVAIERERAFNGPALVAWIARIDAALVEVPPHEQWMAVGGALAQFLTALHALGYGAKTLSGRKCAHPEVASAFCAPGEQLVAFVCAGTASRPLAARCGDEDPDALLGRWQPA
jgi:nitroreductase